MSNNNAPKKTRWAAVVPAAGLGSRMGSDRAKQFLELAGKPILSRTLAVLAASPDIQTITVVTAPAELDTVRALVDEHGPAKVWAIVAGGETRQESVVNGVAAAPPEADYLLIHDGVRPLVEPKHIQAVMGAALRTGAATLGVKAQDTLARVDSHHHILEIPPRSRFWHIQTPQAFWRPLLIEAQALANLDGHLGTDETGLVLRLGKPVEIVEGSADNLKITSPADLETAEMILGRRERQS